ncbi:tRNA-splicing endonuclease subunit Sen2 (nucleomorph) [Chroomonas mesostigmatica CCMP1168]|uniref:tRNA-splicing endonuclease subunit Sen2 n=1 Tax=Chroomonas mesostigmatica CCMP1168 TaxID=1195612 RepID=J7G9U1_9CRYP|nr:tRNA-splicing endonuclease subunit Sen2 [Chroomonas mesostigmatica CCMP1168]|mmetsp:Transcript_66791/g.164616  ORF Transcript_66791/g.164616 Transcript_66791/m.164616 type:complete len:269 (-) Transcript_66791:3431-4237(-)
MKKNLKFCIKKKNARFWISLLNRDNFSQLFIHGKIFHNFIGLVCRSSSYLLRIHKLFGLGKGITSRSEPLYYNPNPCFNSIGRAGRECVFYFQTNDIKSERELSEMNLRESFYLKKNKILDIHGFSYTKKILTFFSKLDSEFFLNYLILKKNRNKKFFIRTGIKYGGSHVVYSARKNFSSHLHSKSVLILENFYFLEEFCKNCLFVRIADSKNLQNKIRLAQQVSKKINMIFFFAKKKKKKKSWILTQYNFERWVPKNSSILSRVKRE